MSIHRRALCALAYHTAQQTAREGIDHAAYRAAITADEAWGAELRRMFGKAAGDIRYRAAGTGLPGSHLRHLHDAKLAADAAVWGNR